MHAIADSVLWWRLQRLPKNQQIQHQCSLGLSVKAARLSSTPFWYTSPFVYWITSKLLQRLFLWWLISYVGYVLAFNQAHGLQSLPLNAPAGADPYHIIVRTFHTAMCLILNTISSHTLDVGGLWLINSWPVVIPFLQSEWKSNFSKAHLIIIYLHRPLKIEIDCNHIMTLNQGN